MSPFWASALTALLELPSGQRPPSSEPQSPQVKKAAPGLCRETPAGGKCSARRPRRLSYCANGGRERDDTEGREGAQSVRAGGEGVLGWLQAILESGFQAGDTRPRGGSGGQSRWHAVALHLPA